MTIDKIHDSFLDVDSAEIFLCQVSSKNCEKNVIAWFKADSVPKKLIDEFRARLIGCFLAKSFFYSP